MIVEWSTVASAAFEVIVTFLEERSKIAATKFEERIRAATLLLARFPESGRRAQNDSDIRELLITPYLLQYKLLDGDRIVITSIRHGARDQEAPDPEQVHEPEAIYGSSATA